MDYGSIAVLVGGILTAASAVLGAKYKQARARECEVKKERSLIKHRIAHTRERKGRLEVGFEYVTDMDGVKIFRKRKWRVPSSI